METQDTNASPDKGRLVKQFGMFLTDRFSHYQPRTQQIIALAILIIMAAGFIAILISGLTGTQSLSFNPGSITQPIMPNQQIIATDTLTPIGKMKGEINGEFEAFYIAMDGKGILYIHHDPPFENRWIKTPDWKEITREKLEAYRKELHFIPSHANGIKR